MSKTYTSFNDLVNMAAHHMGDSIELDCDLTLEVDGEDWKAHTVSVACRDLLFFTDKGTITYFIDLEGDTACAELFDWTND